MTQLVVDRATEQGQGVWVYTTYEPRVSVDLESAEGSLEALAAGQPQQARLHLRDEAPGRAMSRSRFR